MQPVKLSIFDKQKLEKAYIHLYDTLVLSYTSKNMSPQESWYQATSKMKDILAKHKGADTKLAMDYLMEFHIAHKEIESGNMTILSQKNEHICTKDKKSVAADVKSALDEFERIILTIAHPDILVTIKAPSQSSPYVGTFYDWANVLPDTQIELLENDPTEFARQYRRFALSRHIKEK